ncbi:hypothetical protein EDB89DRAFT_2008905 [Lactarius sanguifluus]|nr:hypothetical protein EDB89DRAFT_2008905 [Lactarius sanguifluus]
MRTHSLIFIIEVRFLVIVTVCFAGATAGLKLGLKSHPHASDFLGIAHVFFLVLLPVSSNIFPYNSHRW